MKNIAEIITLALALLGVLSKSVKEGADGKWTRNKYGLPALTSTGGLVVSLLVAATAVNLWINRSDAIKHDNEQASSEKQATNLNDHVTNLTKQLTVSQAKLDEARREIQKAREYDAKEFKSVLDVQRGAELAAARQLSDASTALNRRIKQTNATVRNFAIHVFFEPLSDYGWNSSYNGARPRSQRLPSEIRESSVKHIFCRSPKPLQDLYVWVPLTSNPALDLRLGFGNVDAGKCDVYVHLHGTVVDEIGGIRSQSDKDVDLGHAAFFKNGKRGVFRVIVTEKDLKALRIEEGVPLIEFQASKEAEFHASWWGDASLADVRAAGRYLSAALPARVGINVDASPERPFEEDSDLQATWVFKRARQPATGLEYPLEQPQNLNQWGLYDFLFPQSGK